MFIVTLAVGGCGNEYRTGGPLQAPSAIEAEFPLDRDVAATWGVILPLNPTDESIRIQSVEPASIEGLELLGVVVSDPEDGTIVNAYGFPPDGFETSAVDGTLIPPMNSPNPEVQVLVGIELADPEGGSIEGVRVRYESNGDLFETVLPWTLRILAASD